MDIIQRKLTQGKGKLDKYEETTTLLHQIFGGWLRSRVNCQHCKYASDTYESFLDLNLEIKVNKNYNKYVKYTK